MKNIRLINDRAKTAGLVFGILFFVVIFIGTFNPLGIGLDTKAYIQSAISIMYPIGLFIGLRWKGLGIVVCLVSMSAYMYTYLDNRTIVNYTFIIVLTLIQMIPLTLYILSWNYHRKSQMN